MCRKECTITLAKSAQISVLKAAQNGLPYYVYIERHKQKKKKRTVTLATLHNWKRLKEGTTSRVLFVIRVFFFFWEQKTQSFARKKYNVAYFVP